MTTVIRDAQGDIVGAFCLNLDLGRLQHARSVLDELTQGQPLESPEEETPIHDQDVFSILRHIIRQTISETGVPVQAMDREVKIRIVGFLEERKVFRIKGAVDYLAEQLGVSRYTIYNYLEEVRTHRS
ncbi:MAG: helix-turn-helix transcriptional regulator [Deinococcota bacterium]|nr:helix-turn-helix transcriptional regulator [Deinococcota bacterium]